MPQPLILVVEDEPDIADAVAARLRSEGVRVEIASDGPSGVARCEELQPDLVVLDLMLPGFDGLEVCLRIQRDPSRSCPDAHGPRRRDRSRDRSRGRRRRLPHEAVQRLRLDLLHVFGRVQPDVGIEHTDDCNGENNLQEGRADSVHKRAERSARDLGLLRPVEPA